MYGFRLKFRDIRTGKVMYKLYQIDTCPWDLEDCNYELIAWQEAAAAGLRMAKELGGKCGWVTFDGVTLLFC